MASPSKPTVQTTAAPPPPAEEAVAVPSRAGATSMFVTGDFPRRRGLIIAVSILAGLGLTAIWSASFVDRTIGDNVANTLLGHDAKDTAIAGIGAGVLFAFVSGLAGTFTACNIAVFGAVAPMLSSGERRLAPMVFMGALVGAFLIGRPFALFRQMSAGGLTTLYRDVNLGVCAGHAVSLLVVVAAGFKRV